MAFVNITPQVEEIVRKSGVAEASKLVNLCADGLSEMKETPSPRTGITAMYQKADYEEADEVFLQILRKIIATLHSRKCKDKVSVSLLFFLVRVANTWRTIRLLRKHTPDEFHDGFMVDAGTLLRSMFDAYLQADLIFRDPAKRLERATLYLDFEHVERYRMTEKVLRHDNQLADHLKATPRRPEGENRLQEEFDRVKDPFLKEERKADGSIKRGPGTRE